MGQKRHIDLSGYRIGKGARPLTDAGPKPGRGNDGDKIIDQPGEPKDADGGAA